MNKLIAISMSIILEKLQGLAPRVIKGDKNQESLSQEAGE